MPMDKKPSSLISPNGLPPFVSEEAFREQWKHAPKILGPSIAERIMAQLSKATSAEKKSESEPQD